MDGFVLPQASRWTSPASSDNRSPLVAEHDQISACVDALRLSGQPPAAGRPFDPSSHEHVPLAVGGEQVIPPLLLDLGRSDADPLQK